MNCDSVIDAGCSLWSELAIFWQLTTSYGNSFSLPIFASSQQLALALDNPSRAPPFLPIYGTSWQLTATSHTPLPPFLLFMAPLNS